MQMLTGLVLGTGRAGHRDVCASLRLALNKRVSNVLPQDAIKARNGLAMDYSCQPCSPSSLLTVITDTPNLTILHYSGHGTDTFLTLENDDGSTVPVEREGLSSVLAKR